MVMKQVKVRQATVTSPTDLLIQQKLFLFLDDDVILLTRTEKKTDINCEKSFEIIVSLCKDRSCAKQRIHELVLHAERQSRTGEISFVIRNVVGLQSIAFNVYTVIRHIQEKTI